MKPYQTEEILAAWDNLPRAKAPVNMVRKIETQTKKRQLKLTWMYAAAIAILCMLNLGVIASYRANDTAQNVEFTAIEVVEENVQFLNSHGF